MERIKNSYISGIGASLALHLALGGIFAWYALRETAAPEQVFEISLVHPGELSEQSNEGGSKLVELRPEALAPKKTVKKIESKVPPRPVDSSGEIPVLPTKLSGKERSQISSSLPQTKSSESASAGKSLTAKNVGKELGRGDGKAKASYQQIILARLEEEKRYPRSAKRMHAEGIATLELVLQKNGSLLSSKIVQSSGFRILDSEVVDLASRAAPYPKMPVSLKNTSITLHVPIEFRLMS